VITIGPGETITLHRVSATSVTAADFVFNQEATVENAGSMVVSDGAVLPLSGMISNTGTIALDSIGDQTQLQIIGNGITLEGGGRATLSGDAVIVGTSAASSLTNIDNTICGAGQIGSGDGTLTLINEKHGIIDADVAGGTLILDTGVTITNDGVLEATNGGALQIADGVIGSGSATISHGVLTFEAQSTMNVAFDSGAGTPSYGELVIGDPSGFSGQISGFTGTAADVSHSDAIDLEGINYSSASFSETYNAATGVLTVTDGSRSASLTFENFGGTFSFASDGHGGTLITDPPATSTAPSVSIAAAGEDTFVFHPGMGAETVNNFNPQDDTIELDHFANVQNQQQLAAAITSDAQGDAVIELGHGDSVTIPGVSTSYMQQHLQTLVHLH
jgi:large repetitive protein